MTWYAQAVYCEQAEAEEVLRFATPEDHQKWKAAKGIS